MKYLRKNITQKLIYIKYSLMNKLKSFILASGLMAFFAIAQTISYAQQTPASFVIDVNPSTFDTNSLVDMTIKAVNANNEIVKEYQWDVFIEIEEFLDSSDYVVPSDGFYTFLAQDQWIKLFSKWLNIKKEWTYTIKVSDLEDENIKWEKTVTIWSHASSSDKWKITLLLPAQWWIEKDKTISLIWNNPQYPNSQFKIFLNDSIVGEGMTDANWNLNMYVTWSKEWENSLQIKMMDVNNIIIAESDLIKFTYSPIKDWVFNSIQLLPWNKVNQWDKVKFLVSTTEWVTSAQIKLSNGKSSPMDKSSVGNFSKEIQIDTFWNIEVSLEIINAWNKKLYTWVANLIVERSTAIGKVRVFSDEVDKTKVNLTRETIWLDAAKYKISYGTWETSLNEYTIVTTKEVVIENLEKWALYYLKIYPLDDQWNEIWTPSDIVSTQLEAEQTCIVKGIKVSDQIIWDKHYLVRSWVLNIEKYIIYRSETQTSDLSQMKKIWESTGTLFEYPFNKFSKNKEYAYYSVVAVCKDWNEIKIDDVKKVQVWPIENIMLFLIISLFIYTLYRLNNYAKAE